MSRVTSPVATPTGSSRPVSRAGAGIGSGTARTTLTLLVIGTIAWVGLVFNGVRLAQAGPPGVGFDLELLIEAGRKAASGSPMYSPALLAGQTVPAQSLFYSYPPFVGQLMALIAWLPSPLVLVLWVVAATTGLAAVGASVARRLNPTISAMAVALSLVAFAPLVMPYAIAVLFGNFNMFFPALYGLILLAALARPGDRRSRLIGGLALGIAAATKVHPAALGLWFLIRGFRERRDGRRPEAWDVVLVAVGTGGALIAVSLLVAGVNPWLDYVAVVRASSGATLLDHRNYGPAAQLGLALGLGETTVRVIHGAVLAGAIGVTAWSAWARMSPVLGFGLAAIASLVILPVTWIHYPAALLPFAVAALASARTDSRYLTGLMLAAGVLVFVAIALPPLLWVGVALVVVALVRALAPGGREPTVPNAGAPA
jgi:hypothetical protein